MSVIEHDDRDLDIMTRTLFGEARGESELGQIGVAWVVRNRAECPAWWGKGVAGVCLKKFQFSCWLESDPNRRKLLALEADDTRYQRLYAIARRVLLGEVPDPTGGATHYRVIGWPAAWAKGRKPSAVIGRHEFFAIGPGG